MLDKNLNLKHFCSWQADKIKLSKNDGGKGGAAWFNIVHLELVFYITGPW